MVLIIFHSIFGVGYLSAQFIVVSYISGLIIGKPVTIKQNEFRIGNMLRDGNSQV